MSNCPELAAYFDLLEKHTPAPVPAVVPAYVYLLPSATRPVFKVGHSVQPWYRFVQIAQQDNEPAIDTAGTLIVRNRFDLARTWLFECVTRSKARCIESQLKNILKQHRASKPPDVSDDGRTEWFDGSELDRAIQLAEAIVIRQPVAFNDRYGELLAAREQAERNEQHRKREQSERAKQTYLRELQSRVNRDQRNLYLPTSPTGRRMHVFESSTCAQAWQNLLNSQVATELRHKDEFIRAGYWVDVIEPNGPSDSPIQGMTRDERLKYVCDFFRVLEQANQ